MPRIDTEKAPTEKALSRRIFVTILKDRMDAVTKVIWEHEKPILEEIFGDGTVSAAPAAALDEGFSKKASADLKPFNKSQNDFTPPSEAQGIGFVFIGDPKAEFNRLVQVYGRHPEENISFAEKVYGRESEKRFERVIGRPDLEDLPEAQLRQMICGYGYLPQASWDDDQAVKDAASKAAEALARASKESLLKTAKEVGVSV